MTLEAQLKKDLIEAMKAKDTVKLETLRMLKAAMTNAMIDKKKDDLSDEEITGLIQKQVKQRQDSIAGFRQANRDEAAAKEEAEMKVLQSYLPEQLSDQSLRELISSAIQETGASSQKDMGKIMKVLMPKIQGRADGKRVNEAIRSMLP